MKEVPDEVVLEDLCCRLLCVFNGIFCERVVYRHGQYSSFFGCATVTLLGGFDHVEDDDQDRGGEEITKCVEALEREEEVKARRDNEQSDT